MAITTSSSINVKARTEKTAGVCRPHHARVALSTLGIGWSGCIGILKMETSRYPFSLHSFDQLPLPSSRNIDWFSSPRDAALSRHTKSVIRRRKIRRRAEVREVGDGPGAVRENVREV